MFSKCLKSILSAVFLLAGSTISFSSVAAEDNTFYYASYMNCTSGPLGPLDKIVSEGFGPVYDAAVKDGTIKGWGWAKHHTGGRWDRIFSVEGDSVDGLLKATATMRERSKKANADPDNVFGKTCSDHVDYIWKRNNGSPENSGSSDEGAASTAGMTVYYQCDIVKEDRADEIVAGSYANANNASVGSGKLTGWGWLQHQYGGKYRRALTYSAANFTDLLNGMNDAFAKFYADDNPEGMEFVKICGSHSDYLWSWE